MRPEALTTLRKGQGGQALVLVLHKMDVLKETFLIYKVRMGSRCPPPHYGVVEGVEVYYNHVPLCRCGRAGQRSSPWIKESKQKQWASCYIIINLMPKESNSETQRKHVVFFYKREDRYTGIDFFH